MDLEQNVVNLVLMVLGVAIGSWIGSEVAIRRVSKSARRIIKIVLDDDKTKEALQRMAKEGVKYLAKTLREELLASRQSEGESQIEWPTIDLPQPESEEETAGEGEG